MPKTTVPAVVSVSPSAAKKTAKAAPEKKPYVVVAHAASKSCAWIEAERRFIPNNFPAADWALFTDWAMDKEGEAVDAPEVGEQRQKIDDTSFRGNGYLDFAMALIPAGDDIEQWKNALRDLAFSAYSEDHGDDAHGEINAAVAIWLLPNGRATFGVITAGLDTKERQLDPLLVERGLTPPDWNPQDWTLLGSEFSLGEDVWDEGGPHPLTKELQAVKKWRKAAEERTAIAASLPVEDAASATRPSRTRARI